jgi:hypothetical protein
VIDVVDIVREVDQLADVVLDASVDTIDVFSGTSDLFKVRSKDLLEFLKHFACGHDVLEDVDHMRGLCENVLSVGELPSVHRIGNLDLLLGLVILLLPVLEHADGLVDFLDRIWNWLFIEDLLNVDLVPDLAADLI